MPDIPSRVSTSLSRHCLAAMNKVITTFWTGAGAFVFLPSVMLVAQMSSSPAQLVEMEHGSKATVQQQLQSQDILGNKVGRKLSGLPPPNGRRVVRFTGKRDAGASSLPGHAGNTGKNRDSRYALSKYLQSLAARQRNAPELKNFQSPPASAPGFEMPYTLQTGGVPTSVATGDFNRDGKMDFAVANGWDDNIWVYLGRGDGTFEVPHIVPLTQGVSPVWLAAVDLRGNGILDLIVADIDSASIGVFLGKGDGTFSYEHFYDAGGRPAMMAVGDYNGDGKKDLFLDFIDANTPSSFATLLGTGNGGFGRPIYSPELCCYQWPFSAAAMDVDHDGRDEVAAGLPGAGGGIVLKTDDSGAFHAVQLVAQNEFGPSGFGNAVTGGAFGDMDEDGCPDSISGWYFANVAVRKGTCKADGFGDFAPEDAEMGDSIGQMIVADVNGDGHLDVITGGWVFDWTESIYGDIGGNLISVAFGKGDGTFELAHTYRAGQFVFSLAVADFNGDGMLDIVGTSQYFDSVTVVLSDGAGGYRGPEGVYIGYGSGGGAVNAPMSAASVADVTGDGIPDLVLMDIWRWASEPVTVAVTQGIGGGRFGRTIFSPTDLFFAYLDLGDYKLGDFNGDGILDIVAIAHDYNEPGFVDFLPGRGDGTFGPSTLLMEPTAHGVLGVGDYDGDGKLDFAVSGMSGDPVLGGAITTFLGNGNGTFRKMATQKFEVLDNQITRFYPGDFNHDGKLDAIVYFTGNAFWTMFDRAIELLGNGDGTYQPARVLFERFAPFSMTDLNHDGLLDIVSWGGIQNINGQRDPIEVGIYLGKSDGKFPLNKRYTPYAGAGAQPPFKYLRTGDPWQSSFVADYNGDGNSDIAVGLNPTDGPRWDWMQVMMGNGDGTLSPNYDIYDLRKLFYVPMYAADLDKDGRSEMIEVDGLRSSIHVFRPARASNVQIYLENQRMETDQGRGWVVVNAPTSSDAVVSLTASDPAVNLPSSVVVPAGSATQDFTFTLGPNFDLTKALQIQAQLNGDSATALATRDYTVGFDVDAKPATPPRFYGGESSKPIHVTVQMVPGYGGHLQFDCGQIQPFVHCQFTPPMADVPPGGTATSTLIVATDPTQWAGLDFEARASDGQVMKRKWLHIDLANFGFYPPDGEIVYRGQTTTVPFHVLGIPPFQFSCSGLPAGMSCSFDPSGWDDQTGMVNMNVSTDANVPDGDYSFTLSGTSSKQSYSTTARLRVVLAPDFTIEAMDQPAWTQTGENAAVSLRLIANESFRNQLDMSCISDAFQGCESWHPFLEKNQSFTQTLTLQAKQGVSPGTYPLAIKATADNITHSVSFQIKVVEFSGTASAISLTMAPNSSTNVDVTASVAGDFAGEVKLICKTTTAIECSFSPAEATVTPANPLQSVLTLHATTTAVGPSRNTRGVFLALVLPFLAIGFGYRWRKRTPLLGLVCACLLASCGGSGDSGGGPPPPGDKTYTVQVQMQAKRGSDTVTVDLTKLTITVKH